MLAVPIRSPRCSIRPLRQSGNHAAAVRCVGLVAGVSANQNASPIPTGTAQAASAPCQPRGLISKGSVTVAAITSPTKIPFV